MCPDKQKELKLKYAHLFGDERTPFNCWGFEFDDGWTGLAENLLAELSEYGRNNKTEIQIIQCKEKLGFLRIYIGLNNSNGLKNEVCKGAYQITDKYEELSKKTCEITGKPGQLCERNGWLKTLSLDKARELGYTSCK